MSYAARTRRRDPQVDAAIAATLMREGEAIGRYTVQDLSASGALLTGARAAPAPRPEQPRPERGHLWVLLALPGAAGVTRVASFDVRVERQHRVGEVVALQVRFVHDEGSEDRLQDALLQMLDARHREAHPAVLVVDPDARERRALSHALARRGHRTIECEAPLGALRVLNDPEERVDAVVMRDGPDTHSELLRWVAEARRHVRPILVVRDRHRDPVTPAGVLRCFEEHLEAHLARPR